MPIYFIRHGESEANEQNRFAGTQNTPLTVLGIQQGEQASRAVAGLGIRFDEVHTSTLDRAIHTADLVVRGLPERPSVRIETPALDERDFGAFTAANKSLVKKAAGFRGYTEYFHSTTGTPPGGESWHALHQRVRDYYRQVLLPRSQAGRTILVVTHKYIVEMFAVAIADIDGYRDMKIPNARPLSEMDLAAIANAPATTARLNNLGEHVEIRLPMLMIAGCAAGLLLRLLLGNNIPMPVFTASVSVLLAVCTFFGMLRVNPDVLTSPRGLPGIAAWTLLKATAGTTVLLLAHNLPLTLLGLALIVPPSTLAPALALLWGGDFHASVRHMVVACLIAPLPLLVVALLRRDAVPTSVLITASIVLVFAVAAPTITAQRLRKRNPIKAGHLTTNWSWLGAAALVPVAALSGYRLVPVPALGSILKPISFVELLCVALVLLAPRLLAGLLEKRRHLYVTHGTPNLFLWLAMAAPLVANPGTAAALVPPIAVCAFFTTLAVDEAVFVRKFRDQVLVNPPLLATRTPVPL